MRSLALFAAFVFFSTWVPFRVLRRFYGWMESKDLWKWWVLAYFVGFYSIALLVLLPMLVDASFGDTVVKARYGPHETPMGVALWNRVQLAHYLGLAGVAIRVVYDVLRAAARGAALAPED